ncbi:MAG: 3'-phosphoesterase [Candidatus Omnitrophica bacterium]|nr:3'-phosphoesterase [Candidatus Omnitrophota bacterium]MCM8833262.1 3'-phosphoesterase [Candidatus Omnitrophota bacterium]
MIFVIQEHFSTHHHFDLRIEINGVLKSWAIPKEIPLQQGDKKLAVEVEDHPLEYANFEGEIPETYYGAGKVKIWDKGEYEMIENSKNKILIRLKGEKIKGEYVLLHFKKEKDKNLWLIFKKNENFKKN